MSPDGPSRWRKLRNDADSAVWSARKTFAHAVIRVRRTWLDITPPALLVMSFLGLIAIGTVGLMTLPGLQAGPPLSWLDALFTMTSAVCVTGLVVVDTGTHFTRLGQAWVLLFIQLGGLGLITLTSLIIGALGRRLSLRSEMLVGAPIDLQERRPVLGLALTVLRYTLIAESVGALMLFFVWLPRMPWRDAAWNAVFHAVSAFCNAGFSTFSTSLMDFSDSPLTLLPVAMLIVAGGLGFLATEEFLRWWRDRKLRRIRLSVHTWAAFWVTGVLLVLGFGAYLVTEWHASLGALSVPHRLTNALFMSVTARTAGFNSVDYGALTNSGVLVTLLLMLVGGSPGSTAGGLKTTTVAVLTALAWAKFRGQRHTLLHGRTVPAGTVQRTVSVVLLVSAIILGGVFFLEVIESRSQPILESRAHFLPLVFEVVSAFCTVGLSMNVTFGLSDPSRVLTILLMFIGRVGPLVFFAAVSLHRERGGVEVREAAEDLVVG